MCYSLFLVILWINIILIRLCTDYPFGAVFICLTNWASNFIVLAVLIGLSGLAVSTFHPMGAGLVSKVAPDGKISTCISIFVAGGSFGFALAPIFISLFLCRCTV